MIKILKILIISFILFFGINNTFAFDNIYHSDITGDYIEYNIGDTSYSVNGGPLVSTYSNIAIGKLSIYQNSTYGFLVMNTNLSGTYVNVTGGYYYASGTDGSNRTIFGRNSNLSKNDVYYFFDDYLYLSAQYSQPKVKFDDGAITNSGFPSGDYVAYTKQEMYDDPVFYNWTVGPLVSGLICELRDINYPYNNSYTYDDSDDITLDSFDDNDSVYNFFYNRGNNEISQQYINVEHLTFTGTGNTDSITFDSLENPLDLGPQIILQSNETINYVDIGGIGTEIEIYDCSSSGITTEPIIFDGYDENGVIVDGYVSLGIGTTCVSLNFSKSILIDNEISLDYGSKEIQILESNYCYDPDDDTYVELDGEIYTGEELQNLKDYSSIDAPGASVDFEYIDVIYNGTGGLADLIGVSCDTSLENLNPICFLPKVELALKEIPAYNLATERMQKYGEFFDLSVTPGSYDFVVNLPVGGNNLEKEPITFTIPQSHAFNNYLADENIVDKPVVNYFILLFCLVVYYLCVYLFLFWFVFGIGFFIFKMVRKIFGLTNLGTIKYDVNGKGTILSFLFYSVFLFLLFGLFDYMFGAIAGDMANIFNIYKELLGHVLSLLLSIVDPGTDFIAYINNFNDLLLAIMIAFGSYVMMNKFGRIF